MSKKELSNRKNWQTKSGSNARTAEIAIHAILKYAMNSDYVITQHPKNFIHIYENVKLDKKTLKEIYTPKETWRHGMVPDLLIQNKKTKKQIFIEIKRQDGWVEGKERKAGRGNAHERSNKLFTPGLINLLRNETNLRNENFLPFWVIFVGDITRDPKRVREISLWYRGYESNFFMFRPKHKDSNLIDHFREFIKPELEKI